MEGGLKIDLDKLPIKRLEAIEESGIEHFPPELSSEETRLNLLRRIDFSSVVERDSKKPKTSAAAAEAAGSQVLPWQSLVENLRQAQQELSVVIDIINTVEANDAVTVAWVQKPKPLHNESLSDAAVCAATKLQRLRDLGRYFKQSSKSLDQQVAREARFYGSLIRLQQNWKVKRHRVAATGPGSESFTIDLQDNSTSDATILSHSASSSIVRVEADSAGILTVQRPLKSCHTLSLRILESRQNGMPNNNSIRRKMDEFHKNIAEIKKDTSTDSDVNKCVKDAHLTLREIHQSIFQEQVFDVVNREICNPFSGIRLTEMREDFLKLNISQDTSLSVQLLPLVREDRPLMNKTTGLTENVEDGVSCPESLELMIVDEKHDSPNQLRLPNPVSFEIYLQYLVHKDFLAKSRERRSHSSSQVSGQNSGEGGCLLDHFCLTIAHRIFSKKVLSQLERVVNRVPYLRLLSHPTWHSRTSSWSLSLKVPQSILHSGKRNNSKDNYDLKSGTRSHFHTKVVVHDDQITVSAEGAPSIIGSFRDDVKDVCSINCYGCDLEDLPRTLLQQIASQIIHWLHEEARVVGMKVSRDFLCLKFNLDQGDILGLLAHIDPDDARGCISWWMLLEHPHLEQAHLWAENDRSTDKAFLGHLSLEVLYSTVMDLVSLSTAGGVL